MASLFKMWARGASQTVVSFLVKQLDESLTRVRWICICYGGSSHNIYQLTCHCKIRRSIQYPCQLLKLLKGQESASFDSLRIGTPEDMQKIFRLHSSVFGSVGGTRSTAWWGSRGMVVFWFQQKDVYSNHVLHKSYLDIQIRQIMCLVFLGIIKCLPGFPGPMDQCMVLVVFVFVCFLVLIFCLIYLKIRCLLFLLVLVLVELQVLMFLRKLADVSRSAR